MSCVHLRLPATSANLGPGFDSVALALKLYLYVEAQTNERITVEATGRDASICGATQNNLLVDTYREILAAHKREFVPLSLKVRNEIPLGMGCGSSAAVRLAAVTLASHYGGLGWSGDRILTEAALLEGHPDNAAACWLGGFVASALEGDQVHAISIAPPSEWRAVIALPDHPLATTASRSLLPDHYTRKDAVANLQRVALLTAAVASGREDLLAIAMGDRLHQPFRIETCTLLARLLPLAGRGGIAGIALSGAGPAVLLLTPSEKAASEAKNLAAKELGGDGNVEFLTCEIESRPVAF
ncbi:MAG TPA: homoserine kinase [Acidobacteriaceae bacterium]|jgi:homoserine kinase